MRYTLTHEFAHIISLNELQKNILKDNETCETFKRYNYCYRNSSYLNQFYQRFYTEENFNHSRNFITNYAQKNIVEDFAVSFEYYVWEDISEYPKASTIRKKLEFFNELKGIKRLRSDIKTRYQKYLWSIEDD